MMRGNLLTRDPLFSDMFLSYPDLESDNDFLMPYEIIIKITTSKTNDDSDSKSRRVRAAVKLRTPPLPAQVVQSGWSRKWEEEDCPQEN